MELKTQLDLEQKKGLEQKNELQKQAVELQSLRSKEEILESEILRKNQKCESLDCELEQAKSELDKMKVTNWFPALPLIL